MRGALAIACATLVLAGCKQEPAPAPPIRPGETDRTLEKLKAEVDRANRGEAVGHAPDSQGGPNAQLAGLVIADEGPTTLALPAENPTVHLGTLALKVAALSAAHSVKGRVELTSEDLFLAVTLLTQNVGKEDLRLTLAYAALKDANGKLYAVAPDAQRVAGTRDLARTWKTDVRDEVTLYFEVPPSVVGKGLRLEFPGMQSTGFTGVTIPLD